MDHSRDHVATYLNSAKVREEKLGQNIGQCMETISNVAELLERGKNTEQVEVAVNAHKDCISLENDLKAHVRAISELQSTYTASEATTDFAAVLDSRTEALAGAERPEDDPRHRNLVDVIIYEVNHEDPIDDDEGDEDIVSARGDVAPNKHCPICGKEVLELTNPVEDHKGFVYEKEKIEDYIRRQGRGPIKCPVAATGHTITMEELKKSYKVIRAQQRRKRAPAAAPEEDGEDAVLDC